MDGAPSENTMISLVMTSYNRPHLLKNTLDSFLREDFKDYEIIVVDDGADDETPVICEEYGVRYCHPSRPDPTARRNSARPLNCGLRQAIGDIIILQNAECKHIDSQTIEKLTALVTPTNAVFARVIALNEDGTERELYCGIDRPRPYFFCGAIKREWFERLRGFDEDFIGAGWEDDDFADRLRREGVEFIFTDILVHHQWHPPAVYELYANQSVYERKKSEPTVRNIGREWGEL